MFNKAIFLGLIVLIMMQVAVGQTSDVLNNSTNMTIRAPVSVSVGPIGITNACLITTAQDAFSLKHEIVLELNKAKSDLSLQNQQAMDSVREEYDKKYHVAVKQMNEDAENWFGKMKGVLDEARVTISDMIDAIGIIVTIVIGFLTIVIGVFGIILPLRKDRKRDEEFKTLTENLKNETNDQLKGAAQRWMSGYDDLRKNLDQQKSGYDKLLKELQDQKEIQSGLFKKLQDEMHAAIRKSERDVQWLKGKNEYDSAEGCLAEYTRDGTKTFHAEYIVKTYSWAIYYFYVIKDVGWIRLTIWSMHNAVTTHAWVDNREKIKEGLKDWTWSVSLADVLSALESEEDDGRDYAGWFKEIYAEYGKPKA